MKIISSFSGGKTSAYMTLKLKEQYYDDLVVLFANTGQEHEKTLDFVNNCDKEYGLNVIWLESVTHHNKRKSSSYKVVDYESADRDGGVFEEMIKKYGIPNKSYPHCTRELKLNPIKSWIRDNIKTAYKMAIGIRIDEPSRQSKDAEINSLFYPLIDWKVSKYDVNEFWRLKSFDLGIMDYQGNCKTCFKKSNKKLLTIASENPEWFEFNDKMESLYGISGHNIDGTKRVFFRGHKSAKDIIELSKTEQTDIFDWIAKIDEDENSGCSESCEAFT